MEKLKQRVYDVVSYKKNVRMLKIKTQVLEGQRNQVNEENVNGENKIEQWIADADEIFRTATSILEGGNNRGAQKCLFNLCPSAMCDGKKTRKMVRDMNKTLREGLELPSYILGVSYCKNLQSRENMLCDILEASMDTYMIGIYGMIGVGKTVLVKELARRAQDNRLFDSVVMVPVPDSLNVKLIQAQIANQIGLQLSDADDEERRATFLHNMLVDRVIESGHGGNSTRVTDQQTKILVIFDGMQRVIDLVKVGIPYGQQEQNSRCKVVLISRSADVCKEMGAEKNFLVECLNLDEAKILFRERLRRDKIMLESERYQYVENATVMRCRGLPLMINSLASALRSVSWYDWQNIADKMGSLPLLKVDQVKDVASAILDLCNGFLQNKKKHKLFLLCCLIHKGADVNLEKLKRYGIGFGLFDVHSSLAPGVGKVNSWVDELKSLSLLVESKEKPQHVMVHDIVQDVATSSLSEGDDILHVVLDASTCRYTRESYENCIAISVMPDGNDKCLNGLKLDKLQALLLKDRPSLSLPDNYFQGMQNLRILDIYGTTFKELPSSIGNLESLVTLHLECCTIKCLSSISKLAKLEVLSLRGSFVEDSPVEIGNLINLRVLDLTWWKNDFLFHRDVDVVVRLVQLRELYVRGRSWFWTEFTKLNSSLDLEVLEIDIAPRQLSPGALHYSWLRRFIICIEDNRSLEQYNSFSHVLVFNGNGSFKLEESGLIHLLQWTEMLQIKKASGLCNGVSNLSIHSFSQLERMYIESCSEMECIVDADKLSTSQRDIFPELQILTLRDLPKLEKICCWQPSFSSFSKLRELVLQDLGKLYPHVLPIQLATQLRYLEVIDCIRLLFIFPASDVDGTERIVKLPCLEKLELEELISLQAIQEPSNALLKMDKLERPYQVLFNDKIELPSLKIMCLVNLDQIKKLWDMEPHGRDPLFGSLKSMKISGCTNLECLFSTNIVDSLLQLEELEVESCGRLKEVFTSHAEDDADPSKIKRFPKLQTLKLGDLKSLQCFFRGSFVLEFPALRVLKLNDLREMKTFIDPVNANARSFQTERTLFLTKVGFPSLEHLHVSYMNVELIQGHQDITIFPNLSSLTLNNLPSLKSTPDIKSKKLRVICLDYVNCIRVPSSIWPINMPPILAHKVEELTLSGCNYQQDNLEELVDKHNLIDIELLSSLKNLKLMDVRLLRNIQWNVLGNLRSLIIHQQYDMTSLISTSLLVGGNVVHHLEYLEVRGCRSMQVIVSDELEVDEDLVKYGVTLFPSLKRIKLGRLSNLELFSRGRYEALFPSLERVEIFYCERFQSFSLGAIRTPRLKSLEFCRKTVQTNTFDDLNVILKESVAAEWRYQAKKEARMRERENEITDRSSKKAQVTEDSAFLKPGAFGEGLITPKAVNASATDFDPTLWSLKGVATEEWQDAKWLEAEEETEPQKLHY